MTKITTTTTTATADKQTAGLEPVKRCFVIMPISDHPDYPQGHFTRVYEELIKPSVEDAGFECKRSGDDVNTRVIILDILRMITEYDMAICDLSSLNPNVMYELGVRQMAKKPVTLIKDEKTKRIFDVGILSDIPYDSSLRVDLVRKARQSISTALKATYSERDNDSSSLLHLLGLQLQLSTDTLKVSPSEGLILNQLETLARQVNSLRNSIPLNIVSVGNSREPIVITDAVGSQISIGDILTDLPITDGRASAAYVIHNGIRRSKVNGSYKYSISVSNLFDGVRIELLSDTGSFDYFLAPLGQVFEKWPELYAQYNRLK